MQRVLFVAPMGAGKGTMAAHLLAEAAKAGKRALFIVHLRDIAEDMAGRVGRLGVRVGMVLPGHKPDASAVVQIASVQSIVGRKLPRFDLVIVDEAHHYRSSEWQTVTERIGKARLVGFTATPERSDGKGLGDVFDELIDVVSYSELLKAGHIVPCRMMVPPHRLDGDTAMEPAEAYLKYARGTSALVFVRNLKSAAEVRDKLCGEGITAETITDSTRYGERTSTMEGLRSGKVRVVVNFATMTEGIDAPRVSTIVLEQPCLHAGSYMQRVGRALRAHPGKDRALLLDLCGASYKHGSPLRDDRTYHLSGDPMRLAAGMAAIRRAPMLKTATVVGLDLVEADDIWLSRNGGPRTVDWSSVDWSMTNGQIAGAVGVSTGLVFINRRKAQKAPTRQVGDVEWSEVDWAMSNESIASLTGKKVSRIKVMRSLHAPVRKRLPDQFWQALDWSRSNRDLAREHGIDNGTVGRNRLRLGHSPYHIDWDSVVDLGKVTDREVAERHGVSCASVCAARNRRGITARDPRRSTRMRTRPPPAERKERSA